MTSDQTALQEKVGEAKRLSIQNLNRTAGILAVLLVVFTAAITWFSWTSEKAEAIGNLATVTELEAKALDGFFTHLAADLKDLADDVPSKGGRIDLELAYVSVKKFKDKHPEIYNVTLIRPDGAVLLSAKNPPGTTSASLAKETSFVTYIDELKQGKDLAIGQPLIAVVSKAVIVPLRYAARDSQGNVAFIVSANLPHEHLRSFWMDAPITAKAAIGLIRDNGFLLSRYPVPGKASLDQIYGQPRTGALINYLREQKFPKQGYVLGSSSLDGEDFLTTFRRLPGFPVTLFAALPMAEVRAAWWSRVSGTYAALLFVFVGGFASHRYALRRQLEWDREQKHFEDAQREAEHLFRVMADSAPVLIWISGTDKLCFWFNKVWLDFTGRSIEQEMGNGWEEGVHPDDFRRCLDTYVGAFDAHRKFAMEYRLRRFDGEYRWLIVSGEPRYDDQGTFLGYIGSCVDITERKQAEKVLRESELRFSLFMENLPACAYIKDAQGKHIFVNVALASQAESTVGSLHGRTNSDLWPQEIAAKLDSADTAVITSRSPLTIEEDVLMKNEMRTYRTTKFPIQMSNGETLLGGVSFDITERKQAEENLRRSENKFKMLFALSPVGMAMVDHATGEFLEVNNSILQAVGYTKDEFLKLSYWDITPREYEAQQMQQIRDLNEKGRFGPNEKEYIRKDGSRYPLRISGAVFTEVSDRPVVWGVIEDITKSKQAEAELIQHRDHLEELVAARTSELEQSRDAAEAGNRAKTIFLANMSHELRTPMNGVIGMIDLVLRRATDPKQIDWLNKSRGAAQRMINVVNDIIDFSKIEADRLPLEEKNFSLSQMIDDVVAMQDLTAEAKGLTLIREIPATFPDQLSGDAFRLRQILLNLLGNACKFSDQGTITVRVSVVDQNGDSVLVRVEVEDQGIGISPAQQAMLFQPFAQVDGSTTRKYGGSGLGLIISKRLANLLGGDAGLVSQEGRGSTFWATVRLKPAKASAAGV
jgi:PAS domain S-box-containing protein